jgi:hypothetical protein
MIFRLAIRRKSRKNIVKVDGMVAKNEVDREGDHHWDSVWDCGDRGLFAIWTCHFCVKNIFPFPLATGKLTGDVLTNRQSGTKCSSQL